MSAFEELGVMPEIIQALEDMSWNLPTPVQTEAVPLILGGGDVAAAAETGSGKTGAFCLPILQTVFETRRTNLSTRLVNESVLSAPVTLSATDRGIQVAVDVEHSIAQCRNHAIWQGARASRGVARGKWYFTARPDDDGLVRVGWSSAFASLNLGTDRRGFGYGATGMISFGGKFDPYGSEYKAGDCIVCAVEFYEVEGEHSVKVSFWRNGKNLGTAFDVSATLLGAANLCLIPACAMKNGQVSLNFSTRVPELDNLGFQPIGFASSADANPPEALVAELEAVDKRKRDKLSNMNSGGGGAVRQPLALILEPSRELAGQVEEELRKFSKYLESDAVRHLLLIGGGKPKAINASGCDIVTGTLGTIQALVKKGSLSLDSVRFFVLDEADTFATDNLRDVLGIHAKIPARNCVQTLLFSATLHSPEIIALSEKIQSFPTWIDLKGKDAVPETVHHTLVRLDADADASMLKDFNMKIHWPLDQVHDAKLKGGKHDMNVDSDASDIRSKAMKKLKLVALKRVIDANDMNNAMLFVRTQLDGDNLESFLLQCSGVPVHEVSKHRFRYRRDTGPEVEYSCAVLHGGRRQEERQESLAAFKNGEVRFLVCTDVAARGIDIAGLPYLVNVTLPDKAENYIHRVGRVGRAERYGLSVSLVSSAKEAVWYHSCGKAKNGVCKNRKLVSAGGCVLWYNEPKLLNEIEDRLQGLVEELGENFKRKNSSSSPVLYGAKKGEKLVNEQTAANVDALRPTVKTLIQLEQDAQDLFFSLQESFPLVKTR